MFRHWLTMKERCPTCGLLFAREEGFFLGAYVVNVGLVLIVLFGWVMIGVIATQPDPPVVALCVGGIVVSALVAIGFYPASKTVWSAIDLILTPRSPDARGRA